MSPRIYKALLHLTAPEDFTEVKSARQVHTAGAQAFKPLADGNPQAFMKPSKAELRKTP
ncbi:hypothetical protein [Bifidobacterium aemilianum]|uniref:hypothetical protein n=1 Tax=Bifidobacterium aemilianum TaxID=2493120 RepID=UPI0013751F62|nr:hypothetical protein [Bifidobacterium aemilianum]